VAESPPVRETSARNRKRGLIALGSAVAVGGIAWFAFWYAHGRIVESTDDAYVSGDLVQITSEVPGTITAVHVDDTQSVQSGQALADLDPADAKIGASEAEANLARAVRQVRGLFAQADQLRAQITEQQTAVQRAERDLKRREGLLADGAVSGEELSHSRDTLTQAQAGLSAAREQLNATLAQIQGTRVETHPDVLRAEAAVRNAALALKRTHLVAPVAGVVARRTVQVGQRIAAGAPLMAVIPLDQVWVDANFKEVQLRQMRVGQPVKLRADLYGKNAEFRGKLVGLSAGSGSAFALLPAQNASGNWIKVVQRVPVRIALDPEDLQAHPLRLGLSMVADVNVQDTSGPLVATSVRTAAHPTVASDGNDPEVDARIARIVSENGGAALANASVPSSSSLGTTPHQARTARFDIPRGSPQPGPASDIEHNSASGAAL
jgi:membrane fusion protein (multidrug efflux system)